jgi:hypothetical protein
MLLQRLGLLLIAIVLGGAFLIEHGNHTRIGAPDPSAEPAGIIMACLVDLRDPKTLECRP